MFGFEKAHLLRGIAPGASGEPIEERAELEFAEERGHLLPVVPLVTAAGIQVELDGDVPHDRRQLAAQLGYVAGSLKFVTVACGDGVEVVEDPI